MDLDVVVPASNWSTTVDRIKKFCLDEGLVASDGYRTDNVHVRSKFGMMFIYLLIFYLFINLFIIIIII
jgi:hypothetical protein